VVEAATIILSTDSGGSAATHPGWQCDATSMCICREETAPAISASSATQPVVVHLIHRSAAALTAALRARTHQTRHIGFWVHSDLGHCRIANAEQGRCGLRLEPATGSADR
jgi:hypothetical protein